MCNSFASFVIARDHNCVFKFASLQSPFGLATLRRLDLPTDLSTVVLVESGNTYYLRSTAVLRILGHLTFPYYLASWLLWIPRPIRDAGYWCVASSRYQLWGKRETCEFHPEWANRFLSECPQADENKLS
eukprot:TRINITY_DN4200_c0_g1_i1.p1 TRINITY_DN4200_c0_g1~~TRINITY_DN4200_c0_g1_i1.p1  ORF type:complete len:130 (+),score=2.09 TRINITY_DN4200_c0_g1_i1:265-654(+)